tara:strand:+ start:180 stop:407 length:228 start_codon:yes stop_codon:yes gene_type:complete
MTVVLGYRVPDVTLLNETEAALYLKHEVLGEAWFPKSHAKLEGTTLLCSMWIARKKGWDPGDQPDDDLRDLGRVY